MSWLEITIRVPDAAAEAIVALLNEFAGGCASQIMPEGTLFWAWLPAGEAAAGQLTALRERLASLPEELVSEGQPEIFVRPVEEQDWAEAWKAFWHPQRVGKRLVIKPSWRSWPPPEHPEWARPDDILIELDPGMSFGTGAHPTTVLCLEALEEALATAPQRTCSLAPNAASASISTAARRRVIDFGCGSGILTIAALKLGASFVLALDKDPLAVEITRENCQRNGLTRYEARCQDNLQGLPSGWDVIVANISLPVVCAEAPHARELLQPGGLFIGSGFYAERKQEIAAALMKAQMHIEDFKEREHWGCIIASR